MASRNPTLNSMALLKGWLPLWHTQIHTFSVKEPGAAIKDVKKSYGASFLQLYSLYTIIHTTTAAQNGFSELTVSPKGGQTDSASSHTTPTDYLFDDVEGELQALSLQYGDEVLEEDGQMFMAVSKWNQDGHLQHKH